MQQLDLSKKRCPLALLEVKRFCVSHSNTVFQIKIQDAQSLQDITLFLENKGYQLETAQQIDDKSWQLTVHPSLN